MSMKSGINLQKVTIECNGGIIYSVLCVVTYGDRQNTSLAFINNPKVASNKPLIS
jgi:hypothetical protein